MHVLIYMVSHHVRHCGPHRQQSLSIAANYWHGNLTGVSLQNKKIKKKSNEKTKKFRETNFLAREDRSRIAFFQSVGWSVGTTLMPLLFWWLRHWESFMWLTSLPTAMVLIFSK